MFDSVVARQPDAGFVVVGDRRWTYAEGAAQVDAIAAVLAHRYGVGPGDRVAFVAANHPEYVFSLLATQTLGAVVAGLNGWWTGPEMAYGVELTRPVLLIGDDTRLGADRPGDDARRPPDHLARRPGGRGP